MSGILDAMKPHLAAHQVRALSGLREAHDALRRSELQVQDLVSTARKLGISWQAIGSVLGVSRQAAWERFGRSS